MKKGQDSLAILALCGSETIVIDHPRRGKGVYVLPAGRLNGHIPEKAAAEVFERECGIRLPSNSFYVKRTTNRCVRGHAEHSLTLVLVRVPPEKFPEDGQVSSGGHRVVLVPQNGLGKMDRPLTPSHFKLVVNSL